MTVTPEGKEKIVETLREGIKPDRMTIRMGRVNHPTPWQIVKSWIARRPPPPSSVYLSGETLQDGVPIQKFDFPEMKLGDSLDVTCLELNVF